MQALIDSRVEINAMTPAYAVVLGLSVCLIDIETKRVDGSILSTYCMILVNFQLKDKWWQLQVFKKTFLMSDTTMKIILKMLFLTFSKVEINFAE